MTVYKGKIVTGFGRGKYYLEKLKPLYKKHLNMDYFCGTLNIASDKNLVIPKNAVYISGNNKSGGCYFIPAKLFNERVFIVRPEKTKHPLNILEIIAEENLKKKYNLKNGSNVTVEI